LARGLPHCKSRKNQCRKKEQSKNMHNWLF
jgi:hypothetical protein